MKVNQLKHRSNQCSLLIWAEELFLFKIFTREAEYFTFNLLLAMIEDFHSSVCGRYQRSIIFSSQALGKLVFLYLTGEKKKKFFIEKVFFNLKVWVTVTVIVSDRKK